MFKMSIAWLVIYFGGLLLSFVNPIYGLFTYLFEYYLRPSLHWWGAPLPDWRWNLLVSVVLAITFLMYRGSMPPVPRSPNPAVKWLLAFLALTFAIGLIAVDPIASFNSSTHLLKLGVLYMLIVALVRTDWAFDAFVTIHVMGAGWWGWEAYTHPKRSQGRLLNVGSGDTFGDNGTASQLLVVIPFLVLYGLLSKDKRVRAIMVVAAPFIINLFILCNSRGAMVGLVGALLVGFFLVRGTHRLGLAVAAVGLAGAFLFLADPEFIARQQNTANYAEDGSAQSRLDTWRGSFALFRDYPLGAGGHGFARLSPKYIPDVVEAHNGEERAPHNTVVLITSEWGFLGLGLFGAFVVSTFRILRRIRSRAASQDFWFYRSVAVTTSLTGLLISGFFTDRLYAEAPFWMAGLAIALNRLHLKSLEETAEGERAGSPVKVAAPSTLTWAPPVPTAGAAQRWRARSANAD